MNNLHPTYVHLLTETYGKGSLEELLPNGSMSKYADKVISQKFTEVDWLKTKHADELIAIKEQHTNELLELKLKLSNLIDTNYNLMKLLNKDIHAKD